jgi:hypothetical protein
MPRNRWWIVGLALMLGPTSGCGLLCDRYCERAYDRCDRYYRERCAPITGCYPAPTPATANNCYPTPGVYTAPAPVPYCP